jgi:hypothetical protein
MEILYKNEVEDWGQYLDYFLRQTKDGKKYSKTILISQQAFIIIISFLAGLVVWLFSGKYEEGVTFFVFVLFLAEFGIFLKSGFEPRIYYAKAVIKRQIENPREKSAFLASKKSTISDDFFQIESDFAKHQWKWEIVEDVNIVPDFIYVLIGRNNVYIIPKRDFPSPQEFIEFGNKILKNKKTDATLDNSLHNRERIFTNKQGTSKTKRMIVFTIFFVLLGILACSGLNLWFGDRDQTFVDSIGIPAVLDEYMTQMVSKDIEKAALLFYEVNEEIETFLAGQVFDVNYALYTGYQNIEITSWDLEYRGNSGEADISGKIFYQGGFEGVVYASLVTLDGQWKITRVTVYASPAKINNFLNENLPE